MTFFSFHKQEIRRIDILENNLKSNGKIDSGTVQSFHNCETILYISYLSKMSLDNKLLVCNQIWDHNFCKIEYIVEENVYEMVLFLK